jgi:hypothetical protein
MTEQFSQGQASAASVVAGWIILIFDVAALVFGAVMLAWAIQQLNYKGEEWGLVGVLVFGGSALLIQLVLLAGTIWLVRAARRLARWTRTAALLSIIAAILLDGAALGCVFYEPSQQQQAFAEKSVLYQSGLRDAVLSRDVARAGRILDQHPGAISETDYEDNDVLHLAVRAADKPMVEMLLARGADVNSAHWDGPTPLHLAVDRNSVAIARLLLDKGARVNDKDYSGKSARDRAEAGGNKAMIELLTSRSLGPGTQ